MVSCHTQNVFRVTFSITFLTLKRGPPESSYLKAKTPPGETQAWFWEIHRVPKIVISFRTSFKNKLFHTFASKTPCEPLLARFQVFLSTIISPMMEPQGGVREPWFSLKTL